MTKNQLMKRGSATYYTIRQLTGVTVPLKQFKKTEVFKNLKKTFRTLVNEKRS